MLAVVGVFKSRAAANQAAASLRALGIEKSKINVLTSELREEELAALVPNTQGEQPGMVKAMGAVAGGAVGMGLGEAIASLLVPGVGPILAVGIAAGALLGALGGGEAGKLMEGTVFPALPEEELFVYEDALRKGRTVIVAIAEDETMAKAARSAFEKEGAESIDRARELWWLGLRDVEKESYEASGAPFEPNETRYRRGFEAALCERGNNSASDKPTNSAAGAANSDQDKAYRAGYERGCAHRDRLKNKAS